MIRRIVPCLCLTTVQLQLCCNDRHGQFSGVVRELSLPEPELLTLESPWVDSALRCAIGRYTLRLGRTRTWRHHGYTPWVGNWCWNSVALTPEDAADLLNYVIGKQYVWIVAGGAVLEALDECRPLTVREIVD